jgi:hypothetical protein
MKRTLAFLLVAAASTAWTQTPTVVEKPAAKSARQAKPAAKTPTATSKPSPANVKVVPVSAQKPVAVVAKPTAVPVQPATVKAVAVSAARANAPATAKPVTIAAPAKPVVVAAPAAHAAAVPAKPTSSAPKLVAVPAKSDPFKPSAPKASAQVSSEPVSVKVAVKDAKKGAVKAGVKGEVKGKKGKNGSPSPTTVAVQDKAASDKKPAKSVNVAGRRDPFVSPVVTLSATGSGCSSGKRCLAIDQVALKGVVRSDSGMIAVVVNSMDKAYFLHENDPVFNGYVLKITGDSIVFKETFHDKLGKPLTRDVTKTITRPVA